ncbi:hypothetical protein J6590_105465, partial [Homalodisca vitripennis]
IQTEIISGQESRNPEWTVLGARRRHLLDVGVLRLLSGILVRHSSDLGRQRPSGLRLHPWSAPYCKFLL